MKVSMKKISLLLHHKDRESITEVLQDLGVIHLVINKAEEQLGSEELIKAKSKAERVIRILEAAKARSGETRKEYIKPPNESDVHRFADFVKTKKNTHEKQQQEIAHYQKEKERISRLGNFNVNKVRLLTSKGVYIRFYVASRKDYERFDFGPVVQEKIKESGRMISFMTVSTTAEETLPFKEIRVPELSLHQIDKVIEYYQKSNLGIESDIEEHIPLLDELKRQVREIESQQEFISVLGNFDGFADDKLLSIKGWYPIDKEMQISKVLEDKSLVYQMSDPLPDDEVPVKFNNSSYVKLFEPITRIFQLPHYRELDLTPVIAVFYPIFFAYCLGDAGYGILTLAASAIALFTFLKNSPQIALLGIILGAFTTVIGLIKSGSIFGIPVSAASDSPFLSWLSKYVFIPDDQDVVFNAFNVALMIGVIQILTGIIIAIINKIVFRSWKAALSQIGKLVIVLSLLLIFLAEMGGVQAIAGATTYAKGTLIMGLVTVLLFHNLDTPSFKKDREWDSSCIPDFYRDAGRYPFICPPFCTWRGFFNFGACRQSDRYTNHWVRLAGCNPGHSVLCFWPWIKPGTCHIRCTGSSLETHLCGVL